MLAKLLARLGPTPAAASAAAGAGAAQGPLDLMRLVLRYNLHPQRDLHPSWLPATWPAAYRRVQRYGPAGQAVLAQWLAESGHWPNGMPHDLPQAEPDYQFDARLKRLALLDGAALRRLAVYTGLAAHLPLLRRRGAESAQLRRQACRYDRDAADFALARLPELPDLRMDARALQQRPLAAGRLLVQRGHRLLLAALAPEGDAVLRRLRQRFPRRLSTLGVPALTPRQARQLNEVMLLCIVPERLPQWDWLF